MPKPKRDGKKGIVAKILAAFELTDREKLRIARDLINAVAITDTRDDQIYEIVDDKLVTAISDMTNYPY